MRVIQTLDHITEADRKRVGGKSVSLARLHQNGFPVPNAASITTGAYDAFIAASGLRTRIQMEIGRKAFAQMRWEEIWDAALRIRNLFLKNPMPQSLEKSLRRGLHPLFADAVVAVRSSAPGEDARGSSFAGLHESFVNIRGIDAILEHVRLVWASLWSDAAMLYRREIGLDVRKSKMAVLVQEMVDGDRSGVVFTRSPANNEECVIESVHGLNQGLVDGIIAPDRWILDAANGRIYSHVPAQRKQWMVPAPQGAAVAELPPRKSEMPPLAEADIRSVFEQAMAAEALFGWPQDMEWTFKDGRLYVLQSRPISTGAEGPEKDERAWYLSLRRSLDSLKALRQRIEGELVVDMIKEGDALAEMDIAHLPDAALAAEIERRAQVYRKWKDIYWADFIPFAHGMRLFGQFYNQTVRPDDPFEFVRLLETSDLKSIERNRALADLAQSVRQNPELMRHLKSGQFSRVDPAFAEAVRRFHRRYMDPSDTRTDDPDALPEILVSIIIGMAEAGPAKMPPNKSRAELEAAFLDRFEADKRQYAEDLLDLGRASYRLRDDDNMFLGCIEREMHRAADIGKQRRNIRTPAIDAPEIADEIAKSLRDPSYQPEVKAAAKHENRIYDLRARQLIGQPAGQGVGTGIARVIHGKADLGKFSRGEVLVCDAIDPNMTLVVPMAAAIVERRGGMLIHGAIIAREYGIPCVTGVPDATRAIRTGDDLTVDGYLGIITIRGGSETTT